VWWSRVTLPALHARTGTSGAAPDQPLRLVEQTVALDEPDPKALAYDGLLVRWWPRGPKHAPHEEAWLRFVDGSPVSLITTPFLARSCAKLGAASKVVA
jgi:hypothetical protein